MTKRARMSLLSVFLRVSALLMVSVGAAVAQSSVRTEANVAEQYLQAAADQERAEFNLPPLRRDPALVAAARAHALQMLAHGTIAHQFPNEPELAARGSAAGARFSLISENVAESTSAVKIHAAWMHSEGHRHNLLDPNVDAVGIVVIASGHRLFAVEDFEHSLAVMTLRQQESAVAASVAGNGAAVEAADTAARTTCAQDSGLGSGRQAAFVMRYTTADLGQLPEPLRSRLASGNYATAVVAACPAKDSGDFSMYRIAVLLYR